MTEAKRVHGLVEILDREAFHKVLIYQDYIAFKLKEGIYCVGALNDYVWMKRYENGIERPVYLN